MRKMKNDVVTVADLEAAGFRRCYGAVRLVTALDVFDPFEHKSESPRPPATAAALAKCKTAHVNPNPFAKPMIS
jgi:hypothetical protein